MMPDLTLKSCKTREERERRRKLWMIEKAEKKIRCDAARLRMKIARQIRLREQSRQRRAARNERKKLQDRTYANLCDCRRDARVAISKKVLKIVESEEKRRKEKSELKMMEEELLRALGLTKDGGDVKEIKKWTSEEEELRTATNEILDDSEE